MARRLTQRQVVERLLREQGRVGAHELVFAHGITRGASIIHVLRQEGWHIGTAPGGPGELAVYVLDGAPALPPRPAPPPAPPTLGSDGPPIEWKDLPQHLGKPDGVMVHRHTFDVDEDGMHERVDW